MKKIVGVLLSTCLLFLLLSVPGFAMSNSFRLDELGMCVDLPDEHIVFTRNIKDGDPNLRAYGLAKEALLSLMLEKNIYLNAWDEGVNYEIIITMLESPFEDYNQFSDTVFAGLMSTLEAQYTDMGITVLQSDIYQHGQAKFAKIHISQSSREGPVYGLQYHTAYDGKAINVTLQSYTGEIDSHQEEIIQNIVDTIHFDSEPQFAASPVQTKSFTYTDQESGLTFTVPENWVETPMFKEREYIDAKFTSNLEDGLAIIFASQDVYEFAKREAELTTTERLLLVRDVIGNDIFTKEDIAEMFGCKEKDVSVVTYGGREYYLAEVITTSAVQGLTLSTPMTYLARCENGYMYTFQLNASKDNEYYKDLEALVSSAEYPIIESGMLSLRRTAGVVFVAILIVLIAVSSIIIHKRKTKRKSPIGCDRVSPPVHQYEEQQSNEKPAAVTTHTVENYEQKPTNCREYAYCHKCGSRVEAGSQFCHKCGARLFGEEEE